jgi:hypothetical protein
MLGGLSAGVADYISPFDGARLLIRQHGRAEEHEADSFAKHAHEFSLTLREIGIMLAMLANHRNHDLARPMLLR